jgi:hypothetical protein
MIVRPFSNLEREPNGFPPVFAVCGHCKTIGSLALNKNLGYGSVTEERPNGVETVHVGSLRCVEEDCATPKPLFAQWSDVTTAAEREADIQTWRWDGLLCQQGHSILKQGD